MSDMRAKMRVSNVVSHETVETLEMQAVSKSEGYGEDGLDENNTFSKWTPSGSVSLSITNEALFGKFAIGEEYYIDFTKAD